MRAKRRLIYVPILHTAHDMGTLAGSMKEAYIKKFGEPKWNLHVRTLHEMWEAIKATVQKMKLKFKKVKVYQDGLPICKMEKQIIAELAKRGRPNHQLVQWIIQQGATLVGTEDPQLLLEEYNAVKQVLNTKTHQEREKLLHELDQKNAELLKKRDQKISTRIGLTLKPGETGILFIGLLHRVDESLPQDIQVSYLIHRLPFRRSFEMEKVA